MGDVTSDLGFAAQLAADLSVEDLRLVLSVFSTDVRRLTGTMAEATAADDSAAFRRAAHGLAGAAGAVGAVRLEQACRDAMAISGAKALAGALAEIGALAEAALGDTARVTVALDGPGLDGSGLDGSGLDGPGLDGSGHDSRP